MVEITTLVNYTLHRLKSDLYEAWTENKVVLRKCVRQGYVDFCDLRAVLTDLIDLWPSIRPYIRCTGKPEAKESSDRVSVCNFYFFVFLLFPSSFFSLLFFSSSSGGGMSVWLFFVIILRCISRCRGQIDCWWPTI